MSTNLEMKLKNNSILLDVICVSSLGLRVGVLRELVSDEVEGEDGLDGQLLPGPEERRQQPHDQLEGDLKNKIHIFRTCMHPYQISLTH